MEELRKDPRLTTRYSAEQLERLGLAACLISRRDREQVDESTLSRRFTNKGVDDTIASATPAELKQAQADLVERRRQTKRNKRVAQSAAAR